MTEMERAIKKSWPRMNSSRNGARHKEELALLYACRLDRVHLTVPYQQKEEAKSLGAKWDWG